MIKMQTKINHLKARVIIEVTRHGWTLKQLAERMGLTKQGLDMILKSRTHKPSTIDRLADALSVDVETINKPVSMADFGRATVPRF
jgi:transcriptional regulator with XRE-family HTH domain